MEGEEAVQAENSKAECARRLASKTRGDTYDALVDLDWSKVYKRSRILSPCLFTEELSIVQSVRIAWLSL